MKNKILIVVLSLLISIIVVQVGYYLYAFIYNKNVPNHIVRTQSLLPDYQLSISNQKSLNLFLDEINFWEENKISDIRTPLKKTTINSILIRLVPEPSAYWWRQTTNDGKTVSAVDYVIKENGKVIIDIYVWKDIMDNTESRNKRATSLFIQGIFGLVSNNYDYNKATTNEAKKQVMSDFTKKHYLKYMELLNIINR